MEVSGKKKDKSADVLCDLCLLLSKNTKAEHFCADCNEFFCDNCCMVHKVTRYTRNHKLLDSGNMPKQKLESYKDSVCSKHSGKGLKYICEDHNTIFCSICLTLDHKNCNLLFIDDIATAFDKTPEYKSLIDSIASLTMQLQEMKDKSIKKGEELQKSHGKFITDVKAFRKEINQILDTIEGTIMKEADDLKEDHLKLAVSDTAMCDNILAELNIASEKMREQLRYMQHRQLVISAKETEIKVNEYDAKLVEMAQGESMEFEFVRNENLLQSLRSFTTMGGIKNNELPLNPDNTVTLPKEYVSSTKDTPLENYAACKTPKKDISDVPFKFDDTVTLQKECIPYSSTKTTPLKKHDACKTLEKDVLYRKVKAIIRTIMPETFQACVLKMKGLPINTRDELKGVVNLIYEKAISKDTNRIVFANLCRCLSLIKVNDELDNNKMVYFRAILLTRLQREFENICLTSKTKRLAVENRKTDMKKLQHVVEAEKNEIPAAWREIIEFLGEIFKLKMMTENIVHDCIFRLISNMESFHLECACVLLESVGKELDTKAKRRMDQYFVNLKRCSEYSRLSPTTKANILDLTALRLNNWEAPGQSD